MWLLRGLSIRRSKGLLQLFQTPHQRASGSNLAASGRRSAVLPPAFNITPMMHKSQDFILRSTLWTSKSDSRVHFGSRKHVAIILRNSEVRMYAQDKIRHLGTFRHFSAKFETEVPDLGRCSRNCGLYFGIHPDLRIPQDDSHMFPKPKMHATIGF